MRGGGGGDGERVVVWWGWGCEEVEEEVEEMDDMDDERDVGFEVAIIAVLFCGDESVWICFVFCLSGWQI